MRTKAVITIGFLFCILAVSVISASAAQMNNDTAMANNVRQCNDPLMNQNSFMNQFRLESSIGDTTDEESQFRMVNRLCTRNMQFAVSCPQITPSDGLEKYGENELSFMQQNMCRECNCSTMSRTSLGNPATFAKKAGTAIVES